MIKTKFQQAIGSVERNLNTMLQFQSHRRNMEARDIALLVDNNSYVQNWSLTQIAGILFISSMQVRIKNLRKCAVLKNICNEPVFMSIHTGLLRAQVV